MSVIPDTNLNHIYSLPNLSVQKFFESPFELDGKILKFVQENLLRQIEDRAPLAEIKKEGIIEKLINVNYEGYHPVTIKRSIGDLAKLFDIPPEEINFDDISNAKTGIRFEGVELEEVRFNASAVSAFCKFSKDPASKAVFVWDHVSLSKEVIFQEAYNGKLPRWIQTGDSSKWIHPTKGVPTAKVMNLLMMYKLGLKKENVTNASSCAMNAQTIVDVLHDIVIKGKDLQEAIANSQSVQMLSELGEMLGYSKTWLTSIEADFPGAYTFIPTMLVNTGWSEERIKTFGEQKKVKELEKAGFSIMNADFKVPDALNIEVQFTD